MNLIVRTTIPQDEINDIWETIYLPYANHPRGFKPWEEHKVVLAYERGVKSVFEMHTSYELEILTGVKADF